MGTETTIFAECDSCGFETDLTTYPMRSKYKPFDRTKNLCGLCASTSAGESLEYNGDLSRFEHSADVLKAICYVGNAIIAEIRKVKP